MKPPRTRQRVAELRAANPNMKAAEIARELGVTREAVRHHLNVLGLMTRLPEKEQPERGVLFKYDPEFAEQAYHLVKIGGTLEDMAEAFGVHTDTVFGWTKTHPEFGEAVTRGRVARNVYVTKALFHRAKGYSVEQTKIFMDKLGNVTKVPYVENYPPDTHACMFWLKNQDPANWKDVNRTEYSVEGTIKLEQLVVSAEELGKKIRGLTFEADPVEDAQLVENK